MQVIFVIVNNFLLLEEKSDRVSFNIISRKILDMKRTMEVENNLADMKNYLSYFFSVKR